MTAGALAALIAGAGADSAVWPGDVAAGGGGLCGAGPEVACLFAASFWW